ncbi:Snf7-domain-containing protein [Sphaerosporella brunnea]|uniref:Snf7-domain-containing protein n=1 Tax=Sphaerosporella brunnea TaxID=1250544 RepID=A0A5J5EJU1_9PEZI|nr:Snf7-domain-containing protein [Sphaerosporella brunnea]
MGALPSSNRISAHDRAVLNLKVQRDKLKIYQKKISVILEAEHSAAKALLAKGDKPRALLALRRRKYQSTLLSQTDKQLETLEALTSSIEFALIEKDVLYGLKQGNEVLKQIHKEMTVESVERLMEDTAEGIRYQKEISDMLAGVMTNADEDEVEEELAAMEREVNGVPPEVVLPAIPSAPQTALGPSEEGEKALRAKERARARKAALERAVEEEPQPIAA